MSEWSKRVGDVGEEINDKDSNDDAIRQVDRVVLPESLKYEAIYLVDNKRAQFLFDSVNFARHIAKGADLSFFYADTGKNVHPLSRTNHGPFLPVEYVNTTVLALRIADQMAWHKRYRKIGARKSCSRFPTSIRSTTIMLCRSQTTPTIFHGSSKSSVLICPRIGPTLGVILKVSFVSRKKGGKLNSP